MVACENVGSIPTAVAPPFLETKSVCEDPLLIVRVFLTVETHQAYPLEDLEVFRKPLNHWRAAIYGIPSQRGDQLRFTAFRPESPSFFHRMISHAWRVPPARHAQKGVFANHNSRAQRELLYAARGGLSAHWIREGYAVKRHHQLRIDRPSPLLHRFWITYPR